MVTFTHVFLIPSSTSMVHISAFSAHPELSKMAGIPPRAWLNRASVWRSMAICCDKIPPFRDL